MTDAVSTIGLGIDTGTGLNELRTLRDEFKSLRLEVTSLNELKANTQGLTGGVGTAKSELATLGAELKASAARISELEQQLVRMGKTQADSAKATTQAVKTATKERFDVQITSEKNLSEEIARVAKKTTDVVREEAAKRASISANGTYGGVKYSVSEKVTPELAQTNIIKAKLAEQERLNLASDAKRAAQEAAREAEHRSLVLTSMVKDEAHIAQLLGAHSEYQAKRAVMEAEAEAKHRALMFESQMRDATSEAERTRIKKEADDARLRHEQEIQQKRQVLMAAAGQNATLAENGAAYREKLAAQNQEYQMFLARQREYQQRHRDLEQVFRQADLEAEQRKLLEQGQQYRLFLIKQAEHLKEWKEIEALIAKDDKAAQRLTLLAQNQQYQEYLERNRAYAQRESEITQAMRKAEEQEYKLHLMRESEALAAFNAQRKATILDNNFRSASPSSQVGTVKRAAGLVNNGERELAEQLYGRAAVAAVGNLTRMEEALLTTRGRGGQAARELADRQRHLNQVMNDGHSAARGLAGGMGQLWLTYGSVMPLLAGAAITGSMTQVYSVGKDVEYQLQFLRALASEVEREPINVGNFLKITDGTMASVKEASEGMRALSQAGMNQAESLRALPDILDLAAIGEMKVGQAALTATGVVHAFNLELTDISRVGDIFAQVASSSNTSVSSMTESMKQASTVGEMFKVSIEEAAASIGVLAQRNIIGTSAGTALTTALKNVYEPTAKAKAALESLNITTDNGHGGLKNYTDLIEELRTKVSALNESDQAVFLGTISDQRGAKALSALIKNFGDYKDFLDDARKSSDFMSRATLELEDTVQGAAQRMKNMMEGTFIKAFQNAEPAIRTTIRQLTELAGNDSLESMITRVTVAAARFTSVLVEHAKWIGIAAAGYLGLKVVAGVAGWYTTMRTSMALATMAKQANTLALAGNTVALTANERASMAAGRGAIFLAGATRAASAALGPIMLAVTAAVALWQLYAAKTDEATLAQERQTNRAETVLDYYNRQIEKLRELNKELREKAEHDKNGGVDVQSQARGDLVGEVARATNNRDTLKGSYEALKASFGEDPTGWQAVRLGWLDKKVQAAEQALKIVSGKLTNLEQAPEDLIDLKQENKQYRDRESVKSRIEQLIDDAGGGLYKSGTEKSEAIVPELRTMLDQVNANGTAYKEIAPQLQAMQDKINAAKNKLPNLKPDRDAYREAQAELDGKLQAIKDGERSKLADIKSALDNNEIGNLTAIAQQLAVVKKAREDELVVLREKERTANAADKKSAGQQIENKIAGNARAEIEAGREADRDRRQLATQWAADSLKSEADSLRKRGELRKAFEAEFDAKNGGELVRLQKDLDSGNLNPTQYGQVQARQKYLTNERSTGSQAATFNELEEKYDRLMNGMEESLAQVAEKASLTNGFFSDIGVAKASDDIRANLTPAIQDVLAEMSKIAGSLNDNGMKASVSKMSTTLIKEADRSRNAWIAASKSISSALGEAFGKGGKAAGGIVEALVKQRAVQKDIESDLEKGKKADPLKALELEDKARTQSAQLQISTYGSIAGAAKGFFDEQSKGYQAMQAAEQVFRAFEIAESIRVHVLKSGFLTAFTGLFATAKTTEVALEAGTVAPTIAAETAKQTAHGVTGLAAALSLPYPANIPAFAIVAAMLASIGVAVAGGGSSAPKVDMAKERQKYNGTGFQYDAANPENNPYEWELKKSDSLDKAMERLKDNSDIALRFSSGQLNQLESINQGISGLANNIIQATGIRGTKADEKSWGVYDTHSKLGFSSSSTELTDSGISFDRINATTGNAMAKYLEKLGMSFGSEDFGSYVPMVSQNLSQTVGTVLDGGVKARSYADLHSKEKSWWGLSSSESNSTQYGNLSSGMTDQMGAVIKSMFTMVTDAASFLGKDNAALQEALKSVTLQEAGLDKISLKGLSAEEVEKELNAAFSNLGDIMAKRAMPGLEDFKKASEGYLTTLVRVSAGVDQADYTLQKLGITAVDYTKVLNKQGEVATEIVRDSLLVRESMGGVSTGIGDIIKTMSGSADDLADAYEKMNDIRRTMRVTGSANADVTSSMVRGAGGLDKLSSGINDFMENFFTDGEKAAAKATLLQEEFAKLGKPMPKSIQEFKSLVQGIDRTTEAGQTLYGAMISLSGEFADMADDVGNVNPALAKQRAAVMNLIDTANRWLEVARTARDLLRDLDSELNKGQKVDNSQRIAELKKMMASDTVTFEQQLELAGEIKDLVLEKYEIEKENAEKLIEFGRDLREFVKDLRTGDKSPLTNAEKLAEAKRLYDQNLVDLGSSDEKVRDKARDSMQDRADTLLDLAKTYYASSQSYRDIFTQVTEQLDQVGLDAISSGDKSEKTAQDQLIELRELRVKVAGIAGAVETELDIVTQQLATQIRVMDEMSRNLGVISEVPAILRTLPAELAAAMSLRGGVSGENINNGAGDGIRSLYQSLLKREGSWGEVSYWIGAMQKHGATLESIRDAFKGSDEYKLVNGSHRFGLDRVPFDGYVAELHEGESVLTATQAEARRTNKLAMASTASFSSDDRAEMAAEIAELRGVVRELITATNDNGDKVSRAMHMASSTAAEKIVEATTDAVNSKNFDERNKPAYS